MEHYYVKITDVAAADMEAIYDYISNALKSAINAAGQYDRIAAEILSLETMPERFPLVGFEPERSRGLRRLLVDNYSVFYLIKGKTVVVTDVLYSASDIDKRIKGEE